MASSAEGLLRAIRLLHEMRTGSREVIVEATAPEDGQIHVTDGYGSEALGDDLEAALTNLVAIMRGDVDAELATAQGKVTSLQAKLAQVAQVGGSA